MEHRVGDLVGHRYIQWNPEHTDSELRLAIGVIKSIEDLHYSVDWSDPVMNQYGAKYYLPSEILRMKEDINKYVRGEWKAKA